MVFIAKKSQLGCNSQPSLLSRLQSVLQGGLTSPWKFVKPLSRRKVDPLTGAGSQYFILLA